jgi:hypothetical protein
MRGVGQSAERLRFSQHDYSHFRACLTRETGLLHEVFERGALSEREPMAGLGFEAWLIDAKGRPAPQNRAFLEQLRSKRVTAGIGSFNIELSLPPRPIGGDGLLQLEHDLRQTWSQCTEVAREMRLQVVAIGILPSVSTGDLRPTHLSDPGPHALLAQQLLQARHRCPVTLDIEGPDGRHLRSEYGGVMLEAVAASLGLQLRVPASRMLRTFNACIAVSGPLLALAGNSPLLFGQALWQETRIALLEQASGAPSRADGSLGPSARAGLGSGYVGWSLMSCFRENLEHFEPLLPVPLPDPPHRLAHLRLHNDTIGRWVRPLVGFDADGLVHLSAELRALPAGPSVVDTMANLAVALGVVAHWASRATPPESRLPFEVAAANLHAGARWGLGARLGWFDGREASASEAAQELLRDARLGLAALGVDPQAAAGWVGLVERRVQTHRTGARWQLARLQLRHGDLAAVTRDYAERQAGGEPVHGWS